MSFLRVACKLEFLAGLDRSRGKDIIVKGLPSDRLVAKQTHDEARPKNNFEVLMTLK